MVDHIVLNLQSSGAEHADRRRVVVVEDRVADVAGPYVVDGADAVIHERVSWVVFVNPAVLARLHELNVR